MAEFESQFWYGMKKRTHEKIDWSTPVHCIKCGDRLYNKSRPETYTEGAKRFKSKGRCSACYGRLMKGKEEIDKPFRVDWTINNHCLYCKKLMRQRNEKPDGLRPAYGGNSLCISCYSYKRDRRLGRKELSLRYSDDNGQVCSSCDIYETNDKFSKTPRSGRTKYHTVCKRCNVYNFQGISRKIYEKAFEEQGGCCKTCKKPSERWLNIDHDHSCCSGSSKACGQCFRGLLCDFCNKALGLVYDDIEILKSMITYIQETQGRNDSTLLRTASPIP
jgi:hypothetical protein